MLARPIRYFLAILSDSHPIILTEGMPKTLMELGHTVADEVFDLLNSRHGCRETPLSSDGVVKDTGRNVRLFYAA